MSHYSEYEIGYNSIILSKDETYILDASYSDDYIQGAIDAFTDKTTSKEVKRLAWKKGTPKEYLSKFSPTDFNLRRESKC